MTMPAIAWLVLGLAGLISIGAYLTNPFSRFSIVKRPFRVTMVEQSLEAINENHRIRVRQNPWWKAFPYVTCGIHVVWSRYVQSPPARSRSVDGTHRLTSTACGSIPRSCW